MATVVGTTVEWYDYFIYASAVGVVFGQLFFAGLGENSLILGFATVGVSFLFRPLGAFLAGHFGDKVGRKAILMITLIMMGAGTALIGLLPTAETIGLAAPILLVLLRCVQGISAGGEWGGAALMAVEHAGTGKRGIMGSAPQIGVPLGLLLASGVMALMTIIAPGEAFLAWGWRVPFLLSVVLIAVGYYVRRNVEESPVFEEIAERKEETKTPVVELFRKYGAVVVIAALVFAGNNAVGYMTTGGFIQNYATDPDGPIALPTGPVLWIVTASAAIWLLSTLAAGRVCDHLGRRSTYILGWILLGAGVLALFPLVNQATLGLLFLALAFLSVGLGFTYGPQAALYTELFPASVRFSGVSISYALGSIVGGAFAPMIAAALVSATGSTSAVTIYLIAMVVISLLATLLLRDRTGIPLGPDHEAAQRVSPLRGTSQKVPVLT
ncbi:MAG: MHS family MFS transporter [Brachybacterium sp.]|uniref:MFS transporter n=1 Tax=Brachybacterium sp. TaxID=1891286 RepID=UPI0026497AD4|nr:MFS transporter [Brachybacterium sp.]MDN5687974.1 MHS family MFS transporter [Brachybacterium sp.]